MDELRELMRPEIERAAIKLSAMLLDNIGIKIDTRTLPSHAAFTEAGRELYGRGFWSAIWCQRIRPWLMPMKQQKVRAVHRRWQLQFQNEMLNAVLEAGEGLTDGENMEGSAKK